MDEKTLIKEVMALRGWSQATLAKEAGFKNQSNIGSMLNGSANGIRIDNLVRIFNALGCEVVIRSKFKGDDEKKAKEWIIDMKSMEEKKKEIQAKKGAGE